MAGKWPYKRVEEIALKIAMGPFGSSIKVETFTDSGIPIISGQHLREAQVTDGDFNFITEAHADSLKNANVQRGDVIFTHAGNIGQVAFIPDDSTYQRYVISQRQFYLRCNTDLMLPEFITYYFKTPEGQHRLLANANQVGVPSIARPSSYLKTIEVPAPSIEEQQVVVRNIKALDAKIRLSISISQTLEAMAQALFKSWFVDFDPVKAKIAAKQEGRDPLRAAMTAISGKPDAELDALPPEQYDQLAATAALFPDEMEDSELGEIPRGWSVGTLSDFASFQNGYAFKTKDWTDSGHPVVKIGNVKPGIIYLSGCSFVAHETVNGLDRFALKRGDLLVGMTGYVGETGLVPALDSVAYLNQRVGRISTVNGVSDIGYPFCLVRDPAYKAYAESKAHGSAQANVSGKDLMDYKAVVSDTRVLKIFNAYVAKIINALLSHYEEKQSLAVLRDTLLPKLLSGELSVTDVTRKVST